MDFAIPSGVRVGRAARVLFRGLTVAITLAGIGSLVTPVPPSDATPKQHKGPVDVLYAGSLVGLMEEGVGPAFDGVTGYTFNGFSAGSQALANEIKGKTQLADVFVSASPAVDATLTGANNGNWLSWYATFATSPLVIGYNPASPFSAALKSKPWYQVVTQPNFILGRTDPTTDPKGRLAVDALQMAAVEHDQPALKSIATSTSDVYAEQSLVGLLQAGQVDAGFFYASEASAAGIPTVSLGSIHLEGQYTVTVLNRAPHPAAADAFVAFLLSRLGRSILGHDGLSVTTPPKVTETDQVPASLRSTLHVR